MTLDGASVLVAGATGALGSGLARALAGEGASVALAGRDAHRLKRLGDELGAPTALLDLREQATISSCLGSLTAAQGGLDAIVVASGVVAFGSEPDLSRATVSELFSVNALGPIALIRTALGHLRPDGAVVAVSAVVAEHPTAGMAAYSASKAALSAYLAALRRERRRDGLLVLDVRPPHLDTGFESRALAGTPPALPAGADHRELIAAILDAIRDGRRELAYDLRQRELVAR